MSASHQYLCPEVLAYVNETVEFVKTNRTHVTPEQREVCTNKTEAFVAWWENVTALQAEKKATDEPACAQEGQEPRPFGVWKCACVRGV